MNEKSNVNVKIDTDVKQMATYLLERMGIDQTTAIDMYYRQIIAERCLPFKPIAASSVEEQIVAAAMTRGAKKIDLTAGADGAVIIDKTRNPELYNWAENG